MAPPQSCWLTPPAARAQGLVSSISGVARTAKWHKHTPTHTAAQGAQDPPCTAGRCPCPSPSCGSSRRCRSTTLAIPPCASAPSPAGSTASCCSVTINTPQTATGQTAQHVQHAGLTGGLTGGSPPALDHSQCIHARPQAIRVAEPHLHSPARAPDSMVPPGPGRSPSRCKTVLNTSKAISSMALLGMTRSTSAWDRCTVEYASATGCVMETQEVRGCCRVPRCCAQLSPAAFPPKNAVTPPSRQVSAMISNGLDCDAVEQKHRHIRSSFLALTASMLLVASYIMQDGYTLPLVINCIRSFSRGAVAVLLRAPADHGHR
jgi:hypothetical protein